MGGGGGGGPSTTAHSYSAKVCSFVRFCLLSFSVTTARRYYMICIYSVNTVCSILVLKTGSGDNMYLIRYHSL